MGLRIEDHVGDLPLRRRGDKYLITNFYDIRDSELEAANRCRLLIPTGGYAHRYLLWVGSGDHVTEAAWLGQRDTDRPH
jgi:hypothetical protein